MPIQRSPSDGEVLPDQSIEVFACAAKGGIGSPFPERILHLPDNIFTFPAPIRRIPSGRAYFGKKSLYFTREVAYFAFLRGLLGSILRASPSQVEEMQVASTSYLCNPCEKH